jgi:T5SS/PEP-CTERM-associated repeat protein
LFHLDRDGTAAMASISWKSGNSGVWTDASNWTPAVVPETADDALIAASGTYVVTIPSETVNSITLNDPSATLSSGSSLTINNALAINTGTLDIATGIVNVLGAFTNAGTVVDSGSLQLFGSYGAPDIERIGGTGGSIALAGSLDNSGGTLDGSGLSQLRILGLGTIVGGTVTGIHQQIDGTLDNVTWQGLLDTGSSQTTILDGLIATGANGSGPGTITLEGGSLVFEGDPSLDNAAISGSGAMFVEDTLSLGPGLQINLANSGELTFVGSSPVTGVLNNAGTINVIGQPVFLGDFGVLANFLLGDVDNHGTVEISGTGGRNSDAFIDINAGTFTNEPGALLGAFGGRITISGTTALTNNGTIAASAGSIVVGTLLQGTGQVDISNGANIEFAGAVAPGEIINISGTAGLTLDQPSLFFGTIEGFAPGATIALGVSATPMSYASGDLKLLAGGNQTLDLHIPGPYSLANFVAVTQGGTTSIQVNGSSASAPILQDAGNTTTYVSSGAAVAIDPGLTISDAESTTLVGASISVSNGSFPGDGDVLSASTAGTAIFASYNSTTQVLTLSGGATLADYQRVLRSVAFDSGAADPTEATSQPTRTITWVINDGTTTSAPVTSTIAIQPPSRSLSWTAARNSDIANAANWNDLTNGVNPANLAPDAADTAQFLSGGGTISGTGTVGSLVFGGNSWILGGGVVLDAARGVSDSGSLSLMAGATVISQGNLDAVSDTSGNGAALSVDGANANWTSLGTFIVGEQSGNGTLTITNQGTMAIGGFIVAQQNASGAATVTNGGSLNVTGGSFVIGSSGLGSLLISGGGHAVVAGDAAIAGAGADGSNISVDGAESSLQVSGALQIGNEAAGALSVVAGGTVVAAALDAGIQNSGTNLGAGQIDLIGPTSQIIIGGNAIIGDAGTGAMSILSGATFAATNLIVGEPSGSGAVFISGAGSQLNLSGTLDVGTSFGVGELTIGPNATVAAATAVLQGEVVNEGGLLSATQIVNSGTLAVIGGVAVATGAITGAGELLIGTGSTLELGGSVANTQSIVFAASSGALIIDDVADFQGVITQFVPGDQIVVVTAVAANFSQSGSVISVIGNGSTLGVLDFANAELAMAATSTSGALADEAAPCFASGTRIATERGEVPVDELVEGDRVQVIGSSPQSRQIVWIGERTVDCSRHPAPEKVWPVRIRTAAFGSGRPYEDLWLSPDHAVFVGEVLIPVKYLINGSTIAQVPVEEITYYHIELPRHSVLLAGGLPAESYLDTGDRTNFANGGGPVTLYPDFSSRVWDAEGCAPLIVTGAQLELARRWVNGLAHDLHGRDGAARYRAAG